MPTEKRSFGDEGEDAAEEFLRKKKYKILERNFLVHQGEIDIIAQSPEKEIVFIEVKTRRSNAFGSAIEAISPQKTKRLTVTSYIYLKMHGWQYRDFRIDVIGVTYPGPKIEHIVGAIEGK